MYDEELHAELVATLGRALRPGAVAHSVFCDRPWSFNFFVQLAEAGAVPPFVVSEVEPSERLELDTEAESLHLHVIARPVPRAPWRSPEGQLGARACGAQSLQDNFSVVAGGDSSIIDIVTFSRGPTCLP